MNNKFEGKNHSISLLRIISCLLIVWNHTSSHMLNGFFNYLSWSNIGVQIFMFMSGWLYGGKKINKPNEWYKRNYLKLMKPYWIYLLFIIPVILLLDPKRLPLWKIIAAIAGLQGFGAQVEGLGQHWFISYLLICYAIIAFVLNNKIIMKKLVKSRGGVPIGQ